MLIKNIMSLLGGRKGHCRTLKPGQVARNFSKQCGPNQTYVHATKKVHKATRHALKRIHRNVARNVHATGIGKRCSSEDVAEALDHCMMLHIEPVRQYILEQEHMGIETFPSARTLAMIKDASQKATRGVPQALSGCTGNKQELKLLVDKYVQETLSAPSQISDLDQKIITDKIDRVGNMQAFIDANRSGLSSYPSSYPSSSNYLSFKSLLE